MKAIPDLCGRPATKRRNSDKPKLPTGLQRQGNATYNAPGGRDAGLRIQSRKRCGFDSLHPHFLIFPKGLRRIPTEDASPIRSLTKPFW